MAARHPLKTSLWFTAAKAGLADAFVQTQVAARNSNYGYLELRKGRLGVAFLSREKRTEKELLMTVDHLTARNLPCKILGAARRGRGKKLGNSRILAKLIST